jgi:drug/metabolite transporter (DMT)-like permease
MFAIMSCCVIIVGTGNEQDKNTDGPMVASSFSWLPIVFGLLTPVAICLNGVFTKYVTGDELKFNPTRISFTCFFIVNVVILIAGVIYWNQSGTFNPKMFWVGLVGSTFNTLGHVCI